jgi:hypothetical protein
MWRNLTINVPRGHKLTHSIARHGHRSHRRHDTHNCNGEPNSPVSKLPFSRISTGSSSSPRCVRLRLHDSTRCSEVRRSHCEVDQKGPHVQETLHQAEDLARPRVGFFTYVCCTMDQVSSGLIDSARIESAYVTFLEFCSCCDCPLYFSRPSNHSVGP